jgi:ABC-type antimicrobial peptide transport system ATPase subunit
MPRRAPWRRDARGARAIVRDPRILILILDEATSAVDNETEAAIQRSLEKLVVGRTSLMIAHRLSTVRHADCVHGIEGGRIVQSGTHDELVAAGGQYAALWRSQTGEAAQAPAAQSSRPHFPDRPVGPASCLPISCALDGRGAHRACGGNLYLGAHRAERDLVWLRRCLQPGAR